MTEQPPTPPHGAFDWLLSPAACRQMELQVPREHAGEQATLRVTIEARARVAPSRGWGIAIVVWGILMLLATCHAHARPAGASDGAWGQAAIGQQGWATRNWGERAIGSPYQDGRTARCWVWNVRGERHVRCEPAR